MEVKWTFSVIKYGLVQEEWRLTIKDAKGNHATAEELASMYDFSLDRIYPTPKWVLILLGFILQDGCSFGKRPIFSSQQVNGYFAVPFKNVNRCFLIG